MRQRPATKNLFRSTIRRRRREAGLRFRRGQRWGQSSGPHFEAKNQIVILYRNPPANAVAVCLDELGPLQTIPRGGRSWCRQAARRPDRYGRNGTVQLLAAFQPHLGHGVGRPAARKTGEAILDFLQRVVLAEFPRGSLYLIWDIGVCT